VPNPYGLTLYVNSLESITYRLNGFVNAIPVRNFSMWMIGFNRLAAVLTFLFYWFHTNYSPKQKPKTTNNNIKNKLSTRINRPSATALLTSLLMITIAKLFLSYLVNSLSTHFILSGLAKAIPEWSGFVSAIFKVILVLLWLAIPTVHSS